MSPRAIQCPLPDAELGLAVDPALCLREPDSGADLPPSRCDHSFVNGAIKSSRKRKHQGATFISVYNKDPKYTAYMKGHSKPDITMGKELSELHQSSVHASDQSPDTLSDAQREVSAHRRANGIFSAARVRARRR